MTEKFPAPVAIVGNGSVSPKFASEIDRASYVIRFNKCDNFGVSGTKTDVVVFTTIGPGGEINTGNAVNPAALAAAREFLFTKHPDIAREQLLNPKPFSECAPSTWKDWSEKIRQKHMGHKPFKFIPADIYRAAELMLAENGAIEPFEPSSGFVTLFYLRSEFKTRIKLFGFTHEGWIGHPFSTERKIIDKWEDVERVENLPRSTAKMSFGDEVMACGQALALSQRTGKRVRIIDKSGKFRWNDLWRNIPEIIHPKEAARKYARLMNGPGARPYINYAESTPIKVVHTDWRARDHIGRIVFDEAELAYAEAAVRPFKKFILIEPNIAQASSTIRWSSNPNKQWGKSRWQQLVRLLDFPIVQIGPAGTEVLDGVYFIKTDTFRLGVAVMRQAALSILPEGGLHHAAAAIRNPAIVLFGGATDPNTTGYPHQTNIVSGEPCYMLRSCDHCSTIWEALKPEEVAETARRDLKISA